MEATFLLIPLIFSFNQAFPAENDNSSNDTETARSELVQTLATIPFLPSASNDVPDLTSFPYESYHDVASSYGPPPEPQPSFGISVNTQAILAPQVEVVRFVEAFLRLKSELLARLQSLLNENWDLGRAIMNIIIGKIQKLQSFLLKGVGLIRNFLEFVLSIFSNFSLTLPSLTLGATGTQVHPHPVYGVPPSASPPTEFSAT